MDIKISIIENEKDKDFTEMLSYWKRNFVIEYIHLLDYNLETIATVYFLASKSGVMSGGFRQFTYCPAVIKIQNSEHNPNLHNNFKNYFPFVVSNFLYDSYMVRQALLEYLETQDGVKTPGLKNVNPRTNLKDRYTPTKEGTPTIEMVLYIEKEKPTVGNTLVTELKLKAGELFPDEFKKYLVEHTKIFLPTKIKAENLLTFMSGRYPFHLNKNIVHNCGIHKIKLLRPHNDSVFGTVKIDKFFNTGLFFNNMQIINEEKYSKRKIDPFKNMKQAALANSNNALTGMLVGWDVYS